MHVVGQASERGAFIRNLIASCNSWLVKKAPRAFAGHLRKAPVVLHDEILILSSGKLCEMRWEKIVLKIL